VTGGTGVADGGGRPSGAEADRASPHGVNGPPALARAAVDAIAWLAHHWLILVAASIGLYLGLAFAAPLLDMAGMERGSSAVYFVFRFACHQLPQRSWFLGGRSATVDWPKVQDHLGLEGASEWQAFHRPIRDPFLGYQVALCQRDVAIFGGLFLVALALAVVRRRRRVRSLPLRLYALAALPLAVDGLSQLAGLRESTPLLRTVTGALFGAATGLLVLPLADEGLETTTGSRSVDPTGADEAAPPP
jgi:uncharacterized membrane protein